MQMPVSPSSANCFHKSWPNPSLHDMSRQWRSCLAMPPLSARKSAAVSRSIFWSSLSSATSGSRKAQNVLGYNVELDLARAAFDRIGLGSQPVACGLAALGPFAVPFERIEPAGRHHQLMPALVELRAGIFHHGGACGVRLAGLEHLEEALAHCRKSESVDVEGSDLGAQERIVRLEHAAERSAGRAQTHAGDHFAFVTE